MRVQSEFGSLAIVLLSVFALAFMTETTQEDIADAELFTISLTQATAFSKYEGQVNASSIGSMKTKPGFLYHVASVCVVDVLDISIDPDKVVVISSADHIFEGDDNLSKQE